MMQFMLNHSLRQSTGVQLKENFISGQKLTSNCYHKLLQNLLQVSLALIQPRHVYRRCGMTSKQCVWIVWSLCLTHILVLDSINQPWVTTRTKRICRKKKRLYNKAHSTGLASDWSNYKNIKKSSQHECRRAYYNHVSRISDPRVNNKKFWSFHKNCRNTGITTLTVEGNTITDDTDKANALNDQFKSVFTIDDTSVTPEVPGPPFPDMDCIEVNVEGVTQLLSNLDAQKAGGPDNIPTRFLKEFSSELAPCLTIFFQGSLEQGIIPDNWRKAFVVPVFKRGDRCLPANCDWACENRVCGHKLHPITLQVISQYWNRIFTFCNLYHKGN